MDIMKSKWVTLPSVGVVLLILLQTSVSFIRDFQAGRYVDRIYGEQVAPLEDDGVLISWNQNTTPPACPVTLSFIWEHESGFAFIEDGTVSFSGERHTAVAKIKNGHISIEPLSPETVEILRSKPGEWHYKIQFKYDCAFVKNEWVSWINFDRPHLTTPIKIIVEDTDG